MKKPALPMRPDLVKKTIIPDVLFQAHSATMDVKIWRVVYRGKR